MVAQHLQPLSDRLHEILLKYQLKSVELNAAGKRGGRIVSATLIKTASDEQITFEDLNPAWPEIETFLKTECRDLQNLNEADIRVVWESRSEKPFVRYSDDFTRLEAKQAESSRSTISATEIADYILANGRTDIKEGLCADFEEVWALVKSKNSMLIDRSPSEDGIRMIKEQGQFLVYETERGYRSHLAHFKNLDLAAQEKAQRLYQSYCEGATRFLK